VSRSLHARLPPWQARACPGSLKLVGRVRGSQIPRGDGAEGNATLDPAPPPHRVSPHEGYRIHRSATATRSQDNTQVPSSARATGCTLDKSHLLLVPSAQSSSLQRCIAAASPCHSGAAAAEPGIQIRRLTKTLQQLRIWIARLRRAPSDPGSPAAPRNDGPDYRPSTIIVEMNVLKRAALRPHGRGGASRSAASVGAHRRCVNIVATRGRGRSGFASVHFPTRSAILRRGCGAPPMREAGAARSFAAARRPRSRARVRAAMDR
jgi:hypothetical protein